MNASKIEHVTPTREQNSANGIRLSKEALTQLAMDSDTLNKMGIGLPKFTKSVLEGIGYSMDACPIPNQVLPASSGTPIQFLQEFLQGIVYVLTVARKADMLAPVMTVGKWSDQQIVQRTLERLGTPGVYKDHGDIPLSSWNLVYDTRDICQFQLGCQIQLLENERGLAMDIDTATEKRQAVALAFELLRNDVFFNGYSKDNVKCYGFLNDPNLPAFVEVADGVNNKKGWADKTASEIVSDILTGLNTLSVQSGGNVDIESSKLILAIPLGYSQYLTKVDGPNTFGFTATKWLNENYPNITVISVPELIKGNGADNVFYLYAESVADSGTDDGYTMAQLVPAKIQPLNAVSTMKGYEEGYTSALAGCLVKRPYAVTRYTKI